MLLLRSLRARLLIIGVVPVLVALLVTAALTIRSVGAYSDTQQNERRAQQVREMERAATGLSRIYTGFLLPAAMGQSNKMVAPKDMNVTIGGEAYYVGLVRGSVDATALGLPPLDASPSEKPREQYAAVLPIIDRGGAVELPPSLVPAKLHGDVVVARGIFPTTTGDPAGGVPYGMVVIARPPVQVASPAGALRRALVPAFAIGLAVAILLALILGLRLVRPLKRLALAARAVARGDEEVPLDTSRADEIGMVNRAFEDMTVRLAEARDTERQFLMRVSHELRTPLTAIRGQVDALVDGIFEEEAEQQLAYAAITAESQRLNRLVSDLLDLARYRTMSVQASRGGTRARHRDHPAVGHAARDHRRRRPHPADRRQSRPQRRAVDARRGHGDRQRAGRGRSCVDHGRRLRPGHPACQARRHLPRFLHRGWHRYGSRSGDRPRARAGDGRHRHGR